MTKEKFLEAVRKNHEALKDQKAVTSLEIPLSELQLQDMLYTAANNFGYSAEEMAQAVFCKEAYDVANSTRYGILACNLWGHAEPEKQFRRAYFKPIVINLTDEQEKIAKETMKLFTGDAGEMRWETNDMLLGILLIHVLDALGYHI